MNQMRLKIIKKIMNQMMDAQYKFNQLEMKIMNLMILDNDSDDSDYTQIYDIIY